MVKVKNCPRIALPTPLIPTSVVTMKSIPSTPPPVPISKVVPSAPPSSTPPPTKKPFIRGQVGRKFFSLSQPRSYTKIPNGCSLIIVGFQKPLPHETVENKYIILDPFGGFWCAPRVFEVWREEVESGALTTNKFVTHRMALVRNGTEFFLAFSDRKTHVNNVINEVQQDPIDDDDDEAFPNADTEDEREKRDPDFLPGDESD